MIIIPAIITSSSTIIATSNPAMITLFLALANNPRLRPQIPPQRILQADLDASHPAAPQPELHHRGEQRRGRRGPAVLGVPLLQENDTTVIIPLVNFRPRTIVLRGRGTGSMGHDDTDRLDREEKRNREGWGGEEVKGKGRGREGRVKRGYVP